MLTFAKAADLFATTRDKSKGKPLATATYLEQLDEDTYGVRYHGTVVVAISRDGSYKLNSNGYRTKTTKERINDYSSVRVVQKKGAWFLDTGAAFEDGMKVDSLGSKL